VLEEEEEDEYCDPTENDWKTYEDSPILSCFESFDVIGIRHA
jgi:hypothetical protein